MWPQLKWHTEVMRCFSFCSGLYAIYDVITVPSEGIFSFEERGNHKVVSVSLFSM